MKKIDTFIFNHLIDKLILIKDWSYDSSAPGISEALDKIIKQFDENMEDC